MFQNIADAYNAMKQAQGKACLFKERIKQSVCLKKQKAAHEAQMVAVCSEPTGHREFACNERAHH